MIESEEETLHTIDIEIKEEFDEYRKLFLSSDKEESIEQISKKIPCSKMVKEVLKNNKKGKPFLTLSKVNLFIILLTSSNN